MSLARYIKKDSLRIVGLIERDDLDQIIRQELKTGLTLDDVTEYFGRLYEDDLITPAYVWDNDLQTHRLKNNQDALNIIKAAKVQELLDYGLIQCQGLYDCIQSLSHVRLIKDQYNLTVPGAQQPLSGNISTLAGYDANATLHKTNIDAYTLTGNIELAETYPTEQDALNAASAYNVTTGW